MERKAYTAIIGGRVVPYSRMTLRAISEEVDRLARQHIEERGLDIRRSYAYAVHWVLDTYPELAEAYNTGGVRRQSPARYTVSTDTQQISLRQRVLKAGLGDLDRAAAAIASDPNSPVRLTYAQAAKKLAGDEIAARKYTLSEMREDADPRIRTLFELWNLA